MTTLKLKQQSARCTRGWCSVPATALLTILSPDVLPPSCKQQVSFRSSTGSVWHEFGPYDVVRLMGRVSDEPTRLEIQAVISLLFFIESKWMECAEEEHRQSGEEEAVFQLRQDRCEAQGRGDSIHSTHRMIFRTEILMAKASDREDGAGTETRYEL
jgi:hypothetical protein